MTLKNILTIFLASTALACGDDSTTSSDSLTTGSESESGSSASSTSGPTAGSGSESESDTGTDPLEGLALNELTHKYECVDGCDGYRSYDRFELTVTADTAREIEVQLHDFTSEGEALETSEPLAVETRMLEAGVPTTVTLLFEDPVKCRTAVAWKEKPVSVLLSIDGEIVEFDGLSIGETAFEGEC